jgi:hypothetical protein
MKHEKVVSGGQAGVDRVGLDAAMEAALLPRMALFHENIRLPS